MSDTKGNELYWKERQINWVEHYWSPDHSHRQVIMEILKQNPVRSVLEIGCGAGANLYNIKKEFPDTKIAGCDISEDAIRTARGIFQELAKNTANSTKNEPQRQYEEHPARAEKRAFGELHLSQPQLEDIEFKVGSADALPFHGDSFDLVLTDAMLIYIAPDKISRVLREMRRVGYNKFMFVEFHSTSWWKRFLVNLSRGNMYQLKYLGSDKIHDRVSRYSVYDYKKLLEKHNFKFIRIHKLPEGSWPVPIWEQFGHVITAIR